MGGEPAVLERREGAPLGRLIEQPTGLQLGVLAVAVREQLIPDHPLPRQSPDPDLLARLLVARSDAGHPEVLVVPEGAEEVGVVAEHVIRLVAAKVVVARTARRRGLRPVHRPVAEFAVVAKRTRAGEPVLQVRPSGNCRRHPGVVRLLERRTVVPGGRRRDVRLVGGQGVSIRHVVPVRRSSTPVMQLTLPSALRRVT